MERAADYIFSLMYYSLGDYFQSVGIVMEALQNWDASQILKYMTIFVTKQSHFRTFIK